MVAVQNVRTSAQNSYGNLAINVILKFSDGINLIYCIDTNLLRHTIVLMAIFLVRMFLMSIFLARHTIVLMAVFLLRHFCF